MLHRLKNGEDKPQTDITTTMASTLSTSNRMLFLTLDDYGEDDLLIAELSGHEAVSELFEFRLKLLSYSDDISPEKIIGKGAILRIETWDTDQSGGERHWNGYVSRFACTGRVMSSKGERLDIYSYECDIVPWFWFMTQNEDCRIFQKLSVPDIIETIFSEFNYSDYALELSEPHPQLEFCAQYNETTFQFISRLIERAGIHFYFRHDGHGESRHILVFTDNKNDNQKLDPSKIPFHDAGHAEKTDAILSLSSDQQMRTRKATIADWDYRKKGILSENTPTVLDIGSDVDTERFRYPGNFVTQDGSGDNATGKYYSTVMMEAEEAGHLRYSGTSQARSLTPGYVFSIEDNPLQADSTEYLVLSVDHRANNNLMAGTGAAFYGNTFSLQPHEHVFRSPLKTPRSRVYGPQTAIVVGPPGNEIHTDNLGRIKIRFHWDRKVADRRTNTQDEKASCWVRVAQIWAGNGYGTMFIPRVGMEVVVDFLEGDPDRPIVVGCVYNGPNVPPLDLPNESTRTTIKTLSSKGGGGFNELRFEDKKDSEEIFVHAQKDLQLRTGNNRTEAIACDSNLTIGKNLIEHIGENADLKVGKNYTASIESNRAHTVGQEDYLTVGTHQHTDVGMDAALTTGQNFALKAGLNAALTAAANIDIKAGVNLVAEAGAIISLKAGSNSIVMNPGGIFITGNLVMINSGGSPLSAQSANKAEKADKPKDAKEAIKGKAGSVTKSGQQIQAQALRNAARAGTPFCAECEAARKALAALRNG